MTTLSLLLYGSIQSVLNLRFTEKQHGFAIEEPLLLQTKADRRARCDESAKALASLHCCIRRVRPLLPELDTREILVDLPAGDHHRVTNHHPSSVPMKLVRVATFANHGKDVVLTPNLFALVGNFRARKKQVAAQSVYRLLVWPEHEVMVLVHPVLRSEHQFYLREDEGQIAVCYKDVVVSHLSRNE